MLVNETNLQIWYRAYKKQFEKTTKYVKSRKGQTRLSTPSNYSDFKLDFKSQLKDSKLSGKQLAQKMAKQEVFYVSKKQAQTAAREYARQMGQRFDYGLMTKMRLSLFEQTQEYRKTLTGMSSYQQNKLIAQHFFGSQ